MKSLAILKFRTLGMLWWKQRQVLVEIYSSADVASEVWLTEGEVVLDADYAIEQGKLNG